MELATTPPPAATGSRQQDAPPPKAASDALSSDFETFLRMLTTQMENQDPLNPIESQEFAVQLATFSGVEQQIRTNQLLADLLSGLGASGLAQYAGWVGMEARVTGPARFDGAPLTLAPEADPGSDASHLVVRDASGAEVYREALPAGLSTVEWAGMGADGAPLPPGTYAFEIESVRGGEVTGRRPVDHYATVREARIGADGDVEIVLSGGMSVPASEVRGVRTAPNSAG